MECLAWSGVELGGGRREVVGGVLGQAGVVGEVLAEQAVGVVVPAALPLMLPRTLRPAILSRWYLGGTAGRSFSS